MRLFHVLPVLSVLLGARAFSLDSRGLAPHRLDMRSTTDVCASLINVPLEVTLPGGRPFNAGLIDACLCHSGVLQFVETNPVARAAVRRVGREQVVSDVTRLVTDSPSSSNCVYPDNSVAVCSARNVCGFFCTNGFQASPADRPTTCACNAPSVICNGRCVASGLCPSGIAASKKRDWLGSNSCAEMGPAWAACSIPGGGPRAWECINTANDLESCGGCTYPLTAYSPIGKDCSTLPGVADVSCLSGECVVRRCLPGYVPALDGMSCIRKRPASQSQLADQEDAPARVYGLEHVPLGGL